MLLERFGEKNYCFSMEEWAHCYRRKGYSRENFQRAGT